jgi:ribose transport system substrate-binding protein
MLQKAVFAALGAGTVPFLTSCGSSKTNSATATTSGGGSTSAPLATTGAATTGAKTADVALNGMGHYIATVTSLESADHGFQYAVEALGGKFNHQSWDGDQQKLLSQAELFGSLGINGAFSYVGADSAVVPYVTSLAKGKVAYVNVANRVPWLSPVDPQFNGYYIAHENGSFAEESYIVSKLLFQKGGGQGEAIHLTGVAGGASDTARSYGVNLALKEFPGVKIVASGATDWDRVKAQSVSETLLAAHPNVKFVIGQNDSIALGALASVRAANLKNVLIMGIDGDPEYLMEMTKDDRVVATAAGRIDYSAVLGAVLLFDFLNGVKLNPLESILGTDSIVIDTPAAAQALLDLASGGFQGVPPYDVKKMSRHLQGDAWVLPHRVRVDDPANFDWGTRPGTVPTPKPSGFKWPAAYQAALDAGDLKKLNDDYLARTHDIYDGVRAKSNFKGKGVMGAFKELGIADY